MKHNHKGFGAVEMLMVAVVTLLVGLVAWTVWQRTSSQASVNSFQACVDAGNPVMESYPEQCRANGQTFTNPDQKVTSPDPAPSGTQGVHGIITKRTGNCMPQSVDDVGGSGVSAPTSCRRDPYTTPSTVVITHKVNGAVQTYKQLTDIRGEFDLELPAGTYGMYVVYNGENYCNSRGGGSELDCEFTVEAGAMTAYELVINEATD